MAEKKETRNIRTERAGTVAKWLKVLFVLNMLGVLAGILKQDQLAEAAMPLYWVGVALNLVYTVGDIIVLLKLSPESGDYRRAAVCSVVSTVCSVVLMVLMAAFYLMPQSMSSALALVNIVLGLAVMIVPFMAAYYEIKGRAWILQGLDDRLAQNWRTIGRLIAATMIVWVSAMLLAALVPWLGRVVMLALLVGVIALGIWRLVCLYRTEQAVKRLAAQG
jgi:hypothetical protein